MQLTKKQQDIIIGSLLGDGCLERNGNHVRLRIGHGAVQKEYLFWKYKELKNLSTGTPRYVIMHRKANDKFYESWHFSTYSDKSLERFWEIFYRNGTKRVPDNVEELLRSSLSLAVWFMDDGYRRNDCNACRISTDAFSLAEQKLLQRALKKNFGLETKLHKKLKTWNIYISNRIVKQFADIMRPYIIPSLKYKINLAP